MVNIDLQTRFTRLLGLQAPIMSSPMGGSSGGTIAAAVSNAGGLGTFAAQHRGGAEWLREQIRLARSFTQHPFGVGFIVRDSGVDPELFDIVVDEHVPVIHFSFADAGDLIAKAKAAGALVVSQVQTSYAANAAVNAGADVLVAQGTEAGGHSGLAGIELLLEQVRTEHTDVPVLAAGGISSGARMAWALGAGADGVSVGTAFLACSDNPEVNEDYRQKVVEGTGDQTVRTDLFDRLSFALGGEPWPSGIAARVLTNEMVRKW